MFPKDTSQQIIIVCNCFRRLLCLFSSSFILSIFVINHISAASTNVEVWQEVLLRFPGPRFCICHYVSIFKNLTQSYERIICRACFLFILSNISYRYNCLYFKKEYDCINANIFSCKTKINLTGWRLLLGSVILWDHVTTVMAVTWHVTTVTSLTAVVMWLPLCDLGSIHALSSKNRLWKINIICMKISLLTPECDSRSSEFFRRKRNQWACYHTETISLQSACVRMTHNQQNYTMKEKLLLTAEGLQEIDHGVVGVTASRHDTDTHRPSNGIDTARRHSTSSGFDAIVCQPSARRLSASDGVNGGTGTSFVNRMSGISSLSMMSGMTTTSDVSLNHDGHDATGDAHADVAIQLTEIRPDLNVYA